MITELLYSSDQSDVYLHLISGEEISIDIAWEEILLLSTSPQGTNTQKKERLVKIDRAVELLSYHNLRCDRLKKLGADLLLQII